MNEEAMLAHLLPFQTKMVEDMLQEDGLAILAAGLGWQKVVAILLRIQMERLRDGNKNGIVLVIGATNWQKDMILKELLSLKAAHLRENDLETDLPQEVTNETAAQARIELYQTKSCLFITTRILVVDMLMRRVLGKQIGGILLLNAHRVTDSSQDGFAVRLFRESNRLGFVRAFSDQPTSFTSGFAKVEKVMKALFVRKLHLWPRFEASVKDSLDAIDQRIQVVEVEVQMTSCMSEIYQAIAELMDVCIKELRKGNKIDTSELAVESGLFKSFDDIVRRQLDSIWHTVSPRTKQIVKDLRTLRSLAEHLLAFDPVTFLAFLDNLRVTEGVAAIWLFHDAAHTVFSQAKRRVFHMQVGGVKKAATKGKKRSAGDKAEPEVASTTGSVVHPILEPPPKWSLLLEIMEEIQKERAEMGAEASTSGRKQESGAPVLIVASEARTCLQLREVLAARSCEGVLKKLYAEYLLRQLRNKRVAAKSRPGFHGRRQPKVRMEELRAQRLVGDRREEEALLSIAEGLEGVDDNSRPRNAKPKGKEKGGGGRGSRASKKARLAEQAEASEAVRPAEGGGVAAEEEEEGGLLPGVRFAALESREMSALWDVQPAFVVMFDPDIAFVRQLEVYQAERGELRLRVYNLWYSDSLESDRYVTALQREQNVFEELIRQKAYLVLPDLAQDLGQLVSREPQRRPSSMHPDVVLGLAAGPDDSSASQALTRKGGSRLAPRNPPKKLVVDVREFMSSLPSVLYQQGLELVPLTLEVGDYILSPDICLERKSLADLRSSLMSGRLYHQAEAMTKHYKTPILLIEFDQDRAFALHGPADITADLQVNSLIGKLTLLTLHFPRLRIIWSRSLHASAAIFRSLKANHEEPDPVVAASIGAPDSGEALVNTAAIEILRKLPGVTEGNFRQLMLAGGSLSGLATLSIQELQQAMGGSHAANKLRDWLDAVIPQN